MYTCKMKTGSWEWIDKWEWEIKETPKSWNFTRTCPGRNYWFDGDRMLCKKDQRSNHTAIDHGDWTYTVYPNMCWQPFYFEPIILWKQKY